MSQDTTIQAPKPAEGTLDDLTDLPREGAKRLIAEAVDAEVSSMLAELSDYKDQAGRRYVVRNGYLPEREVLTGIGPVSVRVPKVRDRSGSQIHQLASKAPVSPDQLKPGKSSNKLGQHKPLLHHDLLMSAMWRLRPLT